MYNEHLPIISQYLRTFLKKRDNERATHLVFALYYLCTKFATFFCGWISTNRQVQRALGSGTHAPTPDRPPTGSRLIPTSTDDAQASRYARAH